MSERPPVDRAAICRRALFTPEVQAKRLTNLRAKFAEPQFKAEAAERLQRTANTPEAKAARAAGMRATWADPEARAKRIAGLQKAAATPESRAIKSASALKAKARMRAAAERRERARQLIISANLPALKESVDFAERLLAAGAGEHVVLASLRRAA